MDFAYIWSRIYNIKIIICYNLEWAWQTSLLQLISDIYSLSEIENDRRVDKLFIWAKEIITKLLMAL